MAEMEYLEDDYEVIIEAESKKYKNYDKTAMEEALRKVNDNSLTVYAASKKYDIPERTISFRLKMMQKNEELKKTGPNYVLTVLEESQLADWLILSSELGDPKSKDDLIHAAAEIRNLRSPSSSPQFKNGLPTKSWVKWFLKRHPNIAIRTPESISRAASIVPASRIVRFFEGFQAFLEKQNLQHVLTRPDAFYNLDETNFELNPGMKRVYAKKGAKTVYKVDSSRPKENITVCYCFGANGSMLKSQVILKEKFTRMEEIAYASGSVNGNFLFTQTESGWQNKGSFEAYVHRIDVELKDVERPIFIFMDNHASHINYNLFKWCRDREIHMISFPPNCTHILQMCDTSIFGPAKLGWKKEVNDWKRLNGNKEIDEIEFIKILKSMNDRVINEAKIVNGFKGTGIYPLNIQNVHLERCLGVDDDSDAINSVPRDTQPNSIEDVEYPAIPDPHTSRIDVINNQLIVPSHAQLAHIGSPSVPTEKAKAISNYISMLQEAVIPLHNLLLDTPGDYVLNSLIIKQQVNLLSSAFHINSETSDSPSSNLIQNILKPPEPLKRKTKRRYKILNYGIFTSDEVLNDINNAEKEKEHKELEKEEKRKLREEQKEMQETIKRIKKEKVAEKKENRTKELEAKKKIQANRKAALNETRKEEVVTTQIHPDLKRKRGRPSKKIIDS